MKNNLISSGLTVLIAASLLVTTSHSIAAKKVEPRFDYQVNLQQVTPSRQTINNWKELTYNGWGNKIGDNQFAVALYKIPGLFDRRGIQVSNLGQQHSSFCDFSFSYVEKEGVPGMSILVSFNNYDKTYDCDVQGTLLPGTEDVYSLDHPVTLLVKKFK